MSAPITLPSIHAGVVISLDPVADFAQLSKTKAEAILYEILIPTCEAQRVKLSQYGNHSGAKSTKSIEKYDQAKEAHALFNVERVQSAFSFLKNRVVPSKHWESTSTMIRGVVQKAQQHSMEDSSISNGDCIAAMLLLGHRALFKKRTDPMRVNCNFSVTGIRVTSSPNESKAKEQPTKEKEEDSSSS